MALTMGPRLKELDINPLIVLPEGQGVKVADALVNGRAIRIHGFGAVDPNFPFAPTYHMREISSHNLDGVAERQILQL